MSCVHREHRSFWSVEGIKLIMNSQSIQSINGFVICQEEKFLSRLERTLEFGWGMQERQRYQFLWDRRGSITKILVTCKAPLCVSRNLQWKQPWKGSLLVFFVWARWGLGTMAWGRCVGGWHGCSQCQCECPLVSCAPASLALGTKSSQLPSLVLCYLCKVCCCWPRSLFEKLNWRIWKRLMFIRKLFFCHILFLFLKLATVYGWHLLESWFFTIVPPPKLAVISWHRGRKGALHLIMLDAKTWWNSSSEYFFLLTFLSCLVTAVVLHIK